MESKLVSPEQLNLWDEVVRVYRRSWVLLSATAYWFTLYTHCNFAVRPCIDHALPDDQLFDQTGSFASLL